MKNSRYRYLYGTSTHYKSPKFLNFGNENQFRYQIFPIPVARLFHVPNLSDTTKKLKIPGTGDSRYWYVTLTQCIYNYNYNSYIHPGSCAVHWFLFHFFWKVILDFGSQCPKYPQYPAWLVRDVSSATFNI